MRWIFLGLAIGLFLSYLKGRFTHPDQLVRIEVTATSIRTCVSKGKDVWVWECSPWKERPFMEPTEIGIFGSDGITIREGK